MRLGVGGLDEGENHHEGGDGFNGTRSHQTEGDVLGVGGTLHEDYTNEALYKGHHTEDNASDGKHPQCGFGDGLGGNKDDKGVNGLAHQGDKEKRGVDEDGQGVGGLLLERLEGGNDAGEKSCNDADGRGEEEDGVGVIHGCVPFGY